MKELFKFKNSKGKEFVVKERYIPKKFKAIGLCYPPYCKKPRIYLEKNISDKARLATVIEEFSHAFFWERNEKDIRLFTKTLTKFLYNKDDWRKTY